MKFIELLTEYNIPIAPISHHHTGDGWIQIDCPFCGRDSHKWHLGYNIAGRYLNCWKCGYLPLVNTLAELINLPISKCIRLVKSLEKDETFVKFKPKGKLILPKGITELMPQHKRYLRNRGFDPIELQRLWHIKGIGIATDLSWRIFIPITYQNQVVSWTTRTISNSKNVTRYISASLEQESYPHKELLYGKKYIKHAAIIHEGPTDVWSTGPGACCLFSVNYSSAQITTLIEYPVRAVCFDNDIEAQKRAKKLCDELSVFPGETFNVILKAKDAGSASRKEIRELRKAIL